MRVRWIDNFSSFNERLGSRKLWSAFKAMTLKTKQTAVRDRLFLATNPREQEFCDEAAGTIFLPPQDPPAAEVYASESIKDYAGINNLFNMQELI